MAYTYQDSLDDSSQDFTIDYLPLDCIVCVCEYLSVNDLARFSRVCKFFYEASLVGYLWRRHCLSRWTFCNVQQISPGPQRWRRYFLARRRVEVGMKRGRPGRDYKVKTLRGHEKDITTAYVVRGGRVNWEDPHPSLVVSLSQDSCVKAWDISQGKPAWSMSEQGTTAIAVDNSAIELATGSIDGTVTLWDCDKWCSKSSFKTKLGGEVLALRYGTLKSSSTQLSVLMVHVSGGPDHNDQLEIWKFPPSPKHSQVQASSPSSPELMSELWAPSHHCKDMQLSTSGLLAIPGRAGDVHIWDLTLSLSSTRPPPLPPNVTINTQLSPGNIHWVSSGVLVTREMTKISFWDIKSKLESVHRVSFGRPSHDNVSIFSPLREISCDHNVTAMAMVNELIVVGDVAGQVCVYDGSPKARGCLQRFTDHKGAVTDMYADSFRVLTCSKDFSIRVYCWKKDGDKDTLESKYTLLGGSVAHKTHDGFNQLLCESSSCVGVAGNQLKFYTFNSPPLVEEKLINIT